MTAVSFIDNSWLVCCNKFMILRFLNCKFRIYLCMPTSQPMQKTWSMFQVVHPPVHEHMLDRAREETYPRNTMLYRITKFYEWNIYWSMLRKQLPTGLYVLVISKILIYLQNSFLLPRYSTKLKSFVISFRKVFRCETLWNKWFLFEYFSLDQPISVTHGI